MIQSAPTDGSAQAPYLRAAHVQPDGRLIELADQQMWFTKGELRALTLRRGDVVIVEGGAGYGRSAVLREEMRGWGFQNSIVRVRPIEARSEGRFLDYAIQAALRSGEIDSLVSTATIPHFTAEKVARLPIVELPLIEQRAIANYLDRETAQIDAFIAKNEELITLLTERRAAVAAQAVTRGIDDSAVLKESGLGWLGSIPEDWEAVRVKFAVRSLPGFAFASGDFVDNSEATRLLRGVNVGVGSISWAETVGIENPPADVASRYTLDAGDLVLGMDRPVISGGLRVARVGRGDAGTLLVQRVLRLRGTRVRNDYLEYSMAWGGFAMYIEPDFTGVSVPHMSEKQVGNFTIALPDLSTQARIVDHIRDQHSAIDTALDAARRSTDLMRERRAALISAAVTGKIDVGVAV